jgi:hypothetical protein
MASKAISKPIQARFDDQDLAELDQIRRNQLNPPSRAEAVRRLFRLGVAAAKQGGQNAREIVGDTSSSGVAA